MQCNILPLKYFFYKIEPLEELVMLKKTTALALATALFIGLSIRNVYIQESFDKTEAVGLKFGICIFQFANFLVRIITKYFFLLIHIKI